MRLAFDVVSLAMCYVIVSCRGIRDREEDICDSNHYPVGCRCDDQGSTGDCSWQQIPVGHCLSFNESTCIISIGACEYALKLSQQLQLHHEIGYLKVQVSNCSAIDEVVCGPLKRTGLLCSKCEPGYGLALYARSWECVWCGEEGGGGGGGMAWRWGLYLLLELLPLLVFYLLVVLLDMQAATPPYTSYVFFCQLFTQLFRSSPYIRMHFELHSHRALRLLSLTVLDVWSLDFLRHVLPPFCVSSQVSQVEAISLEFACALFPLLLVVGTYLVIELHASDVRVVVCCWRPFHRLCTCLRRSWNPQASIIHAFATFLLLSLSKLTFLCFYSASIAHVYNSNRTDFYHDKNNLELDPATKIRYTHVLYSMLLMTTSFALVVPSILILLYPQKFLRQLPCLKCLYKSQLLWIFMESFQGHYRGGTGKKGCNFRWVAVLQFVNRVVISLFLAQARSTPTDHVQLVVLYLTGVSLFYLLSRPYTKPYMNNIEGFLYGFAAMITLDAFKWRKKVLHGDILLVAMVMPSLVLVVMALYQMLRRLAKSVRGVVRGVVLEKEEAESAPELPKKQCVENAPLIPN